MTCPKCQQDFLLLPEGTPQPALANRPGGAVAVKVAPSTATIDLTSPAPVLTSTSPSATQGIDAPMVVALISIVLIGVAVVVAYVPYGRFISIAIAPLGLFASFLSLLSLDKQKKLAWFGLGGHALVLLILIVWPSLIGLGTWKPPADPNEGKDEIVSVSRESGLPTPASTVDASTAVWQQYDCRIDVTSVRVATFDPNAKTAEQKKIKALKVTIQVSNVGVERALDIPVLPTPPNEIKLLTATGVAIPRKSIDLNQPTKLFPGKTLDITLAFEPPADLSQTFTLELPSGWLGHRDPAIIRIPGGMITKR